MKMKKYFSFLLAMVMMLTSLAITSSAATCSHQMSTSDSKYFKVVNPGCESDGYTVYYCIFCGAEIQKDSYKPAIGHKYGEDKYKLAEDGKSYIKYNECERQYVNSNGNVVSCGYESVERVAGTTTPVTYYRVDFVNNMATAAYDKEITYTNVVSEYKDVLLSTEYFKAGEEIIYDGNDPIREKTKDYPRYIHIGWSDEKKENLSDDDCVEMIAKENTVLYPVFEGTHNSTTGTITYDVRFYILNDLGNIYPGTNIQKIAHGATPAYGTSDGLYADPVKKEDIVNYYAFNGWSNDMYASSGITTDEVINKPIYDSISYYPTFRAIPKNYTVEFYSWDGKLLSYTDKNGKKQDAIFDGVHLRENTLTEYGINAVNNDAKQVQKPGDDYYIYTWTGKWAVVGDNNTLGRTVDLSYIDITKDDFTVLKDTDGNIIYTDDTMTEEKKVIRLAPVYTQRLQVYAIDIEMQIPEGESEGYYMGEAEVQVISKDGQLVDSGKTDANGVFRAFVNYDVPFTVNVATQDGKYLGTSTINYIYKATDGKVDTEAYINRCRVNMSLNPEYETHCSCIHHNTLLQPIWVRILNILYGFFNVKYVCCYDMYSTIGPLLDYTA